MTDFVRVLLENGREATMPAEYVAAHAPDLKVLDAPATNPRGVALSASRKGGRPVKPTTTVNKEAAKKTASSKTSATPAASDEPTVGDVAVTHEEA